MFKRNPMVGISLRNGAIAGVLGMILFLGLYLMGRHPFLIPVYLDFRIILFGVLIFFTLREFRDYFQKGMLSFAQGMLMSFLFTLVFAVIGFFAVWGFGSWKTAFVSDYISLTLESVKNFPPEIVKRIGQEAYEENIKALPMTRAIDLATLFLGQTFVISFFVSIIISVILRRQPKTQTHGNTK